MSEIYFGDFRIVIIEHIREIESQTPEFQSTEWFLLKYLRRIEKNTNSPSSIGEMENSIRALVRFYVDTIEKKSPLGDRCVRIYEEYRKTLRSKKQE